MNDMVSRCLPVVELTAAAAAAGGGGGWGGRWGL